MSGDRDILAELEARRKRLEQAEREAAGDFSNSDPNTVTTSSAASTTASLSAMSVEKATIAAQIAADKTWTKYHPKDDDDDNPNAILNRQHNSLRSQAKIDQGMIGLLDTALPREEGRM